MISIINEELRIRQSIYIFRESAKYFYKLYAAICNFMASCNMQL